MNYCQFRNDVTKRMANAGGGILPAKYQQVEYICTPMYNGQTPYRPYLIIDYYPNAKTEYDIRMNIRKWETDKSLIGVYEESGYMFEAQTDGNNHRFKLYSGGSGVELGAGVSYLYLTTSGNSATNYGTTYTIARSNVAASHKIGIFTCYSSGTNNYTSFVSASTLNYLKIYEDGQVKIDLLPVKRKSDNVAGAYDLINRKFYTNQGTGYFEMGSPV